MSNEIFVTLINREEDFIEDFPECAREASRMMGSEWSPNSFCSDITRRNQDYFSSQGMMNTLVFDSAAVYHKDRSFSSVQIALKSSSRVVTIQVNKNDGSYLAEKIVDKLRT